MEKFSKRLDTGERERIKEEETNREIMRESINVERKEERMEERIRERYLYKISSRENERSY